MTWKKTIFKLLRKCGSDDEWFLYRLYISLRDYLAEKESGGGSMSEEQFYKDNISKMLSTIHNVNWLLKIYSFIKVFADDKEDA